MQLTHSGRLMDGSGLPLAGSQTVTITMFTAETAGTQVWSETRPVTFDEGYFTVLLGEDTVGNPLDDTLLTGDTLYLELDVGGTVLPDRLPVVSVPYAYRAHSVSGGVVDASEIRVGGNTVIDGSGTIVSGGSDTLAALTCGSDQVAVFDGSAWTCGSIAWGDLSGIPGSIADGTDDDTLGGISCADGQQLGWDAVSASWLCVSDLVLTQAEVIAHVEGTTVDLAAGSMVDGAPIVTSWAHLTDRPAGFADDVDDDTQLTEVEVDAFVANNGYADASSLAAIATTGAWADLQGVPADIADGDADDWSEIANIPGGFADGVDDDTQLTGAEVLAFVEAGSLSLNGSVQVSDDAAACGAGNAGAIRFVTATSSFEGCDGSDWVNLAPPYGSLDNPGTSCLDILGRVPGSGSGNYYINTGTGGNIQVYCDMTTDGGGYTYYAVTGGTSTCRFTDANDCAAVGMDIVMPRSEGHWLSMFNEYGATYFETVPGVHKTTAGGNFTGCAMRDPATYGSGCGSWRVGDGGAWWIRDTNFGEPNGDYGANCWLGITDASYPINAGTITGGQGFNDGTCSYCTTNYICSTNDK